MRLAAPVLVLIAALVLFSGLGSVGLLDENEARHLAVAAPMYGQIERLTPLLGGEPVHERPLLGYALDVAGARFPGTDPTGPRAVRAVAMLALVGVTGWLGARRFGARAGGLAALALLTSIGTPVAARTDGPQILASLFGWAACAGFMEALFGSEEKRGWSLVLAWGGVGLALLTGGPLPALWPLGGLALYLRLARRARGWRELAPGWGAAIVIGLALPWYGAMIELHRIPFASRLPWFPYAGAAHGPWLRAPLVAVSLLLAAAFPWCALLPGALAHADAWWRSPAPRRPTRDAHTTGPVAETVPDPGMVLTAVEEQVSFESQAHLVIAWLVSAAFTLALYPQPPLSAALPALPAMALLTGRLLDHALERPERVRSGIGAAANTLALVGIPLAVVLAMSAARVPWAAQPIRLLAAVALVVSVLPFLAMFAGRPRVTALLFALPVAIGTPIVSMVLLPALEDALDTRRVAAAMERLSPADAAVVLVEPPPSSLRLDLWRNLVVADTLAAELPRERAADGATYLMFRAARESDVARAAGAPLEILLRTPGMVLARVRAR
jgi:4-amino-4-deoxy-L-arabinose transferase-like glycosyltransferase